MGSVQRIITCPKCGEFAYDRTVYTSGEELGFCMHCGYYHDRELQEVQNGDINWIITEGGGFGVITELTETGGYSRVLNEGEIPKITENTIFASAMIDGKLTVLKSGDLN